MSRDFESFSAARLDTRWHAAADWLCNEPGRYGRSNHSGQRSGRRGCCQPRRSTGFESGRAAARGYSALLSSGTLQNALTFEVTAAPGANTEANDANFGSLGSVTFPAGSGNGATVTINFTRGPISSLKEPKRRRSLLTGPTLAEQLSYVGGSVLIQDANLAKIDFVNAAQSVSEGSPTALAILARLSLTPGDSLENAVSGSVVVASLGTATANDFDSANFPKAFVFAAGSTNGGTQTVTLAPKNDALPQGNRTLTLGFSAGRGRCADSGCDRASYYP